MGQKVHPYGFRLGYIKGWHSNWYAKDNYAELFKKILRLENILKKT